MDAPRPLGAPADFGVPMGVPGPDAQGMLHRDAAPVGLPKQGTGGSVGGGGGMLWKGWAPWRGGCRITRGAQLILVPER